MNALMLLNLSPELCANACSRLQGLFENRCALFAKPGSGLLVFTPKPQF
jgi:hypothetical protein